MRVLSILFVLFLSWMVSPCFAIQYCKDFLEPGNPGGWTASNKTFDEEWELYPGEEIDLDIWINDVPAPLTQAGFWIEADLSQVSMVDVQAYDGIDLSGPWEPGFTTKIPDAGGPGTYLIVVNNQDGVTPDGNGDILIARVRLHGEAQGSTVVGISTIPSFNTIISGQIVYDLLITPNHVIITQDSDMDGVFDSTDNCPDHPNGPLLGTCITGNPRDFGKICINDEECDIGGFCSKNQEDTYPPEGNGLGDACECEGNFDCDTDCDGTDAAIFKTDFGRSAFNEPCSDDNPCKGDFTCDYDVDGTDAAGFKIDFGRSGFNNACPECEVIQWCEYF